MENDFIQLHTGLQPELIEVKTQKKLIPRRITTIYELTIPKDENISKNVEQEQSEDLSR